MRIGIKFCGGCNPFYDRCSRVSKFREANPGHEYVISDTSAVCDIWMVVCGCSRRCADVSGLINCTKVVFLWDEAGFLRLEQEIQGGASGSRKKKVLHLHEKAVRRRLVTKADVQCFAELTGDESLLHLDTDYAEMAGFKYPPVHGMFLDSLVSAVMGSELPGSGTLYMEHTTRFIRPVYQGDMIEITVEFVSYEEQEDCYVGLFRGTLRNQKGERVLISRSSQMMMKQLFIAAGGKETDNDEFRKI